MASRKNRQRNSGVTFRRNEQKRAWRVVAGRNSTRSNLYSYEVLERRQLLASWTPLTNAPPVSLGTMMLQTDGTVLAHGEGETNQWFRLTPDALGSYVNGTWSAVPSMSQTRLYYGSNVLPDGRILVLGGEYSSAGSWTNTGEIYNPLTNSWSAMASFPRSQFGDGQTVLLPNGRIIAGNLSNTECFLYNPANNSWTATGSKIHGDRNNEETWTLLPDGDILSYDIFSSISTGIPQAQRYDFATGTWIDAGTLPALLSTSSIGFEIGPAVRLADGRIFQVGGNSNTALYNPSTNTWAAGPTIPNGMGADDTPAAIMPNGHVIVSVDVPLFNPPTRLYEYDPVASSLTDLTSSLPSALQTQLAGIQAYRGRMLMLPTGQMLFSPDTFSGRAAYIYTADGGPADAARPTISSITLDSPNFFTITGTQLTGQSAGASYGEDAEMDTNYPIVQLTATDGSGLVYYARSFGWTPGVATGSAVVTSRFELPASVPQGIYDLRVIASGIASAPFTFNTAGDTTVDIGESGILNVSSNWQTVNFSKPYVMPVVVAGPASYQGSDPLTVRIRNVTKTSFEIALDEWDYQDGTHGYESVSYMVMEAGTYTLADGTVIQAGNTTSNHRWGSVAFPDSGAFGATPVVIAQITSYYEVQAANARITNVSNHGFNLRVQEEQGSDYVHTNESVSWIAISKGSGADGDLIYEAGATPNEVTHLGYSLNFDSDFVHVPAFFANMQTYNGGDPATVRAVRTNRVRARIFLEEERSYDAEIRHNPEVVGYFAIEPGPISVTLGSAKAAIRNTEAVGTAMRRMDLSDLALDGRCESNEACTCASCMADALDEQPIRLASFLYAIPHQYMRSAEVVVEQRGPSQTGSDTKILDEVAGRSAAQKRPIRTDTPARNFRETADSNPSLGDLSAEI